jgi:hypothetical protein
LKQSRLGSLVESVSNVVVGFAVAVTAQSVIFPLFGIHVEARTHLLIGLCFTFVSVARSYVLRRFFESFRRCK